MGHVNGPCILLALTASTLAASCTARDVDCGFLEWNGSACVCADGGVYRGQPPRCDYCDTGDSGVLPDAAQNPRSDADTPSIDSGAMDAAHLDAFSVRTDVGPDAPRAEDTGAVGDASAPIDARGDTNCGTELCNGIDDNCDGTIDGPSCAPVPIFDWAVGLPAGTEVGMDSAGNTYVGGSFTGTIRIGPDTLTSAGATDWFVAKINPSGSVEWARRIGGDGEEQFGELVVDRSGNAYVVLTTTSAIVMIDGVAYRTSGAGVQRDLVLTVLRPAGTFGWTRRYGNSGQEQAESATLSPDGSLLVVGAYFSGGTASFGGRTLTFDAGYLQAVVARYSTTDGSHLSSEDLLDEVGAVTYPDVVADENGSVYAVGDLQFGAVVTPAGTVRYDLVDDSSPRFVLAMDESNAAQWAIGMDPPQPPVLARVSGDLIVAGSFGGRSGGTSVRVGSRTLAASGRDDAWIARISSSGQVIDLRGFASAAGDERIADLAEHRGDVVAFGTLSMPLDLGGGVRSAGGMNDLFFVGLTGSPWMHRFSRAVGGAQAETALALAANDTALAALGTFVGASTDLGAPSPLTNTSGNTFVARYRTR